MTSIHSPRSYELKETSNIIIKKKIAHKDFLIPKFNEYYLLKQNNYMVAQLKTIGKHYKLKLLGKKKNLNDIIYEFLYKSSFVIKIQRAVKYYLEKKLNKLRGPAFIKRGLCVNDTDFYNLESIKEISHKQFFSFQDTDKFIYGFDILSLYNLIIKSGKNCENPYNRKVLSNDIIFRYTSIHTIK